MVATGVSASAAYIVHLDEVESKDDALYAWAREGIDAINNTLDKQFDAGWVYGMLELLERLSLACDKWPLADKRARRDFLLVRIDSFIFYRTRFRATDACCLGSDTGRSQKSWLAVCVP